MSRPAHASGFTLVELIVVMAVVIILGALTVPAIFSSLRGSQLSQATQMLVNELDLAHRTALAQNEKVEVRLYRVAKDGMSGEAAGNPTTGKFRALQCFQYDSTGAATPLDKVHWMPGTIIADSNPTLSTLLATGQAKTTWTTSDPQVALPTIGTAYLAYAFDFSEDGSTSLAPIAKQWFLTLHSSLDGDNLTTLPKNFSTLQIDASNGHSQIYRP